ncbi:Mitochondrial dicarboxylate/tricarboxylate transporter DTC [Striga hermonthica]|uniref:Mitochondrial dicarboxylate/tricarboxylate transporter DTC n=1 Tax=Striga hermonthica TaxID=68872 RepID=A0A9N7P2T8_STRHE|nr:Mitochondrial dicarboxylate/tricarboxylate transporter DTC [Striga hermonthica]
MEREGEAESKMAATVNNTHSLSVLKPLVKGCLTGCYHTFFVHCNRSIFLHLHHFVHRHSGDSRRLPPLPDLRMAAARSTRMSFISGVTHTPLSLGLFEIFRNKLGITNHGRPLSLYQEACCGLASGSIAALFVQPLHLASKQIPAESYTLTNLFAKFHHIVTHEGPLTFWRGSALSVISLTTANMGMLTSYKRSRDYLLESRGLSKWKAELSASIISGFSAAACSYPWMYVQGIKIAVQNRHAAGDKHAYRKIPLFLARILTPNNGIKFYVSFLSHFRRWAAFCMLQWWIYERIHFGDDST